jgi:hypothetical protein
MAARLVLVQEIGVRIPVPQLEQTTEQMTTVKSLSLPAATLGFHQMGCINHAQDAF